jgi:hypothetical protein
MCVLSPAVKPCNSYFEHQSATFADIRRSLAANRLVHITGKHGMGKIRLVKEYVHRAREAKWYKGFFWIDIGTERSKRNALYRLSLGLKIGRGITENVIAAIKRELFEQDEWLLVIDDDGNINFDVVMMFPPTSRRHIIVIMHKDTPLPPPPGPIGPPVPIAPLPFGLPASMPPPPIPPAIPDAPVMGPPPPVVFPVGLPPLGPLPQRPPTPPITMQPPGLAFHLWPLDARDSEDLFANIYANSSERAATAPLDDLLDELGHIPLSIEIAASYLRETGENIAVYTQDFKTNREYMMKSMLEQDDSYISAASALAISLQRFHAFPESLRLLCLLVFLDSICIQLWIFIADPRFRDAPLRRIFSSQETLNDALSPLYLFGLVKRIDNDCAISMNRVIQAIIRDFIELESGNGKTKLTPFSITDESPVYWVERAAELMYIWYPTTSYDLNMKRTLETLTQ